MQPKALSPERPRRSLARRLFALFLVASMLPLALSDWVSASAVNDIANALDQGVRQRTTRQTAMQVFDRLMTGKTLMTAALAEQAGAAAAEPRARTAAGQVFSAWHDVAPATEGAPAAADAGTALLNDWLAAAAPSSAGAAPAERSGAGGLAIALRVAPAPSGPPRVLMAALRQGSVVSVAAFAPDHLWAPLANATEDSAWTVTDAAGTALASHRGGDHALAAASSAPVSAQFRLFLQGEFTAADWVFTQHFPTPQVLWYGQRLTVWLMLVASGTLLLTAVLARRLIRRTLEPLEQLTAGTRRLAAGERHTRVDARSPDEIGTLAVAFNDMAGRIAAQFDAIQGLTAIDRDILSGLPVSGLAERVLLQLSKACAPPWAMVLWVDADMAVQRVVIDAAAGGTPRLETLDPGLLRPLAALHGDDLLAVAPGALPQDAPALPPLCAGAAAALQGRPGTQVLLPLRIHQRTSALLAFVAPGTPSAESLAAARELRDRLAVGLATREREHELLHNAVHDSLTGLLNRAGLRAGIDDWLAAAPRTEGEHIALLFLDLDRFKDINDTRGHHVGDTLLCQASARIAQRAGPHALVARQGGDEFAVVLRVTDQAEPLRLANAIIQAVTEPFVIGQVPARVGASVGVAFAVLDADGRDELLRCADVALYAAKAGGRGRAARYAAAMDAENARRSQLLSELHGAAERGEFVLHFQPRVRPQDGVITSAEALIRWNHPTRGLLAPNLFIGIAEDSGLIEPIGRWVLDAACAQMASWRRRGIWLHRLSVNVSQGQLAAGDFPKHVQATLERHGLPATALELEVTESLFANELDTVRSQLETLRAWGVTIALDDFGTGYSSMSMLRSLPIDVLKIDRSFVMDLAVDKGAAAVVRTIVTLATSLDMELVAEGVETAEQARMLGSMLSDELQGYLYSRPLPPAQFEKLAGLQHAEPAPPAGAAAPALA